MTEEEVWKPIPSLNGKYAASSHGRIRHAGSGFIRNTRPSKKDGYMRVIIKINKKQHNFYHHRLVFEAFNNFLPEEVDHIDGNRENNTILNLRAATRSENIRFRYQREGRGGFYGTEQRKGSKKWRARAPRKYGRKWLGTFNTPAEASLAVLQFLEGR